MRFGGFWNERLWVVGLWTCGLVDSTRSREDWKVLDGERLECSSNTVLSSISTDDIWGFK